MQSKKILFLGGSIFQIPPLKYAKAQGHYVITCDYLPDNPGHQFADEYHNVSTTDLEAVLKLAQKSNIDAIVAYASDPAAPTAAYVGNQLGLPSNPYESVLTLTRKDLFRDFLKKHGFKVPKFHSFTDKAEAQTFFQTLDGPVIVKPVDSSGSKGVNKVKQLKEFNLAFDNALQFSRAKKIVIEEFVQRSEYQVAGDGFVVDGQLVFRCWANEHFDHLGNLFVPIGESFPSILERECQELVHLEIQKILTLLDIKIGALNFDFMFDKYDQLFILEMGPRNGGNLIPEVIQYATGVDLVKYTVDIALGQDCSSLNFVEPVGYFSSYILHSLKPGIVKELWFSSTIKKHIVEKNILVKVGDEVQAFNGSNHTLGTMIMLFNSLDEMLDMMDNMEKHIQVRIA
jgi:biotin carboxylase